MGHLKRLDSNADTQAFPGANFEIAGTVPVAQCSEAKIEGTTAQTTTAGQNLIDAAKFAGFALTGKVCHIIVSPTGNTGDFGITGNGDNFLFLDADPGDSVDVQYYITDGGALILTRNVQSFAQFIHAAGYAYTIKGSKLYTNMPSGQLKAACSILFDPLH